MSEIARLFVSVGANHGGFMRGMDAVNGRLTQMSQVMQKAGMAMTKYVTLPIVGAGVAAFKMGKDFESSMSKIVGLVGVAQDQVDEWGAEILQLAPRLGRAPLELADALFFVTSAGLRGAEALETLEIAGMASASGLGETKTIADALTSAINAYGWENLNAAQAADILTAAVREGKLEASALAPVLGTVLPTASAMSVGFEQVAGMLAVFSRTGVDATEGATQLNAVMSAMLKPGKAAQDMLASVGLEMGDLREMAAREPDGLLQVMRFLDETFGDNEEALAQIVPNVRAFRGIMNVLAQDGAVVDSVLGGVANSTGSANTAFEVASETVEFKWNQAVSNAKVVAIELWEVLQISVIPVMEDLSQKLREVTDWWRDLDTEQQQVYLKWAGIAAIAGPLLLVFSQILIAVKGVIWVFGILKGALVGIGVALSIGTGGAVLLVGALVALAYAVYKNWEKVKLASSFLFTYLKEGFTILVSIVFKAWNEIKRAVFDSIGSILKGIEPLVRLLPQSWQDTYDKIVNTVRTKSNEAAIYAQTGADQIYLSMKKIESSRQDLTIGLNRHTTALQELMEQEQAYIQQQATISNAAKNRTDSMQVSMDATMAQEQAWMEQQTQIAASIKNTTGTAIEGFNGVGESLGGVKDSVEEVTESILELTEAQERMLQGVRRESFERYEDLLVAGYFTPEMFVQSIQADVDYAAQNIPQFDTGGVVPGIGPKLIMAHGGETILPTHKTTNLTSQPSANITIMLDGRVIGQAIGQPLVDEIRVRTGVRV